MESVGIRELKEHTSAIIQRVQEKQEEVAITKRGRVVARIVPQRDEEELRRRDAEIWRGLRDLAKQISAAAPKGLSAVEAVREQRRDL
jgi:prevent-host-death family protein